MLPNEDADPPKLNPVLAGSEPVDPKLKPVLAGSEPKSFFLEELSPNENDGAPGVGVADVDPFPNLNPVVSAAAGLLSTDSDEVDTNPVEVDPSTDVTLCLALSSARCFS